MTYALLALCVLVTVPSLFLPELRDALGGIAPRRHPWQPFTAAFQHGWPGVPAWAHLAANTVLILAVGPACERLLGHGRFLALCALAMAANAGVVAVTEGINGSSLIIWAWGPPLYLALRTGRVDPAERERLGVLLAIMYVVVTLALAGLPYLYGWRGNPLLALVTGNLFHLVATAVGVGGALAWSDRIRERAGFI